LVMRHMDIHADPMTSSYEGHNALSCFFCCLVYILNFDWKEVGTDLAWVALHSLGFN
jgi:hypothetical protein